MSDAIRIFGRLEGIAFLKYQGKYYAIKHIETNTTFEPEKEEEQIVVCNEIGSEKTSKFKVKGSDLMSPFIGAVEAERETGCSQFLLIDMDTGDWRSYPITNDLKKKFPWLRDEKGYIA
jgi:hypothetical protein